MNMKWDLQEVFDVVAVLQWVACQVRSWRRKAGGAAPAAWLGPDAAASSSAPAAAASSSVPAAAASSSVPAAEPASSVPAAEPASSVPAASGRRCLQRRCCSNLIQWCALPWLGDEIQLSEFSGCLIEECGRQTTGTFHLALEHLFSYLIGSR